MSSLAESISARLQRASDMLSGLKVEPRLDLIGRVERIGDDVASVRGCRRHDSANCCCLKDRMAASQLQVSC